MLHYQEAHDVVQPENSLPWSWPLLLHPFRYWEVTRDGATSVVIALGNPVLWWGFLVAAARLDRPDLPPACLAGRGRLRGIRRDVPALVRGRANAIHLVHAPGRPVHVSRRLDDASADAAILGRNAGHVFAGATIVAALLFLPAWTGWRVADSWIRAIEWLPDWSR